MGIEKTPEVIRQFLEQYEKEYDHYEEVARECESRISSLLESEGIRAIVTSRAKRLPSLRRKLLNRYPQKHYATIEAISRDIHDLVGVRVALYFPGHRETVRNLLRDNFTVEKEKEFPESSRRTIQGYSPRFPGYCATHLRVRMRPDTLGPQQKEYAATRIEVQVASVLMHSWAEVEHDLIYKPAIGVLSKQEYAILDEINGLVLAGEIALENLESAISAKVGDVRRAFSSHYELAAYLHGWAKARFDAEPPMGRADVLYQLLERINLRTPAAIEPYLTELDVSSEARPMSEQIVDKIIEGDSELYDVYLRVLGEVGAQNPYSASDEFTVHRGRGAAIFSEFLSLWIALERGLLTGPLANLSQEDIEKLNWLRSLRNRVVHDMEIPSPESLAEASEIMRSFAVKIEESVPPEVRAQIREILARLDTLGQPYSGNVRER